MRIINFRRAKNVYMNLLGGLVVDSGSMLFGLMVSLPIYQTLEVNAHNKSLEVDGHDKELSVSAHHKTFSVGKVRR